MNALSLFNGISGLHLALDQAGISANQVYYSEIDKFANKVTVHHYPNDISLGDVTKWKEWDIDWASIDLIGAGFPCQAWSVAGKQLGDKDERGMLFWTTLDIIAHVLKHNPNAKFLMENVKMKKDFEEYITHHTTAQLGYVEKTLINSALVSAQSRNRYYWTNFPVTQPDDEGILLRDVLEDGVESRGVVVYNTKDNNRIKGITEDDRGYRPHNGDASKSGISECGRILKHSADKTDTLTAAHAPKIVVNNIYRSCERIKDGNTGHIANATDINGMDCIKRVYGQDGKAPTLTTMGGGHREPKVIIRNKSKTVRASGRGSFDRHEWDSISNCHYRKLTPIECERLQTLPDNWTAMLSNTQRYKSIGNGWTIKVISHILKGAF